MFVVCTDFSLLFGRFHVLVDHVRGAVDRGGMWEGWTVYMCRQTMYT